MKNNIAHDTICPIAHALSMVGDCWSMLILRELTLETRTFDDIQANTGMSSQVLATRLKQLEGFGIIERKPYSTRPLRYAYYATAKGRDLDPILLLLRSWGMKWGDTPTDEEPAVTMLYRDSGEEIGVVLSIGPRNEPFSFSQVDARMSSEFAAERSARRQLFQNSKDASRSNRLAR